jgi:predicted secreted protein with PEFG-CTERM motif
MVTPEFPTGALAALAVAFMTTTIVFARRRKLF